MKEKTAGQSPAHVLSEKENSQPVALLSAGQLVPFPGHPFRVAEDGELEQLMESIREYGVLTPLLARPKGDGSFELISGHRRKLACEKLGVEKIPVGTYRRGSGNPDGGQQYPAGEGAAQ